MLWNKVKNNNDWGEAQDAAVSVNTGVYTPQTSPPYVVALDAGHGGSDVGAIGQIQEVLLTETTVSYLNELLLQDDNYLPILCREYGQGATSTERAQQAVNRNASLLISVHGNSSSDSSVLGFECYAQTPGNVHNEQSLHFAAQIATQMSLGGQTLRGEAGVRYIYYEGDDVNGWEKRIAEVTDSTIYEEQTFGLLEHSPCPAVLVEQCFLTSATDVANWGTEEGCARAARVYYQAICAYFGTTPIE